MVAVDDASPDHTPEILADRGRRDPRLWWRRNLVRVGMVANWRLVFELAVERHPHAEYFAWASDHDVWHPRWLEAMIAELDEHPEAVLAYPQSVVIDASGELIRGPWSFDTGGVDNDRARLKAATRGMRAGEMVYGLFRIGPLKRAGVFRPVLWPDRLLLVELTLEGTFRQVPEVLWQRRFGPAEGTRATARRQRRALYAGRPPLIAHLPWWLGHALALIRRAPAGPLTSRPQALSLAVRYLALTAPLELTRELLRVRNRVGTRAFRSSPRLARGLLSLERLSASAGRPVKLTPADPRRPGAPPSNGGSCRRYRPSPWLKPGPH